MFDVTGFRLKFDTESDKFVFEKFLCEGKDLDDYIGVLTVAGSDGDFCVRPDEVAFASFSECCMYTMSSEREDRKVFNKMVESLQGYNRNIISRSNEIIDILERTEYDA